MPYRTDRSTKVSGKAAKVSRASHEGQVFGFNHLTSWSWMPRVLSQRDRGTPLTAGVRRTLGLTKGRPGVQSTIGRAPTRRTACTPAWTRRAPASKAASIRRPLRPNRSETTLVSVILVPSHTLMTRFCAWARLWIKGTRVRVRARSAPWEAAGYN
jgi:hypothetical protein